MVVKTEGEKTNLGYIKEQLLSLIFHTPKCVLNNEEIRKIRKNGLVHFTEYKNKHSIEDEGIRGGLKVPMRRKEKWYTWYYIYEQEHFYEKLELVHKKGARKKYDAYVIIKDLSDEQIARLRIRRILDDAVIYPSNLRTNNMVIKRISEVDMNEIS